MNQLKIIFLLRFRLNIPVCTILSLKFVFLKACLSISQCNKSAHSFDFTFCFDGETNLSFFISSRSYLQRARLSLSNLLYRWRMSVNYRPVSHVIFDLDGTLIDSESYYYCAVNDLLQEYGKQYDWEVRSRTLGLFITKSAPIIIEFCQLPLTPDQFVEKVLLRFRSYVLGEIDGKGVKMLPGAMRLIEHFKATGVPMAICTGSMKQTYDYKVCLSLIPSWSTNFVSMATD